MNDCIINNKFDLNYWNEFYLSNGYENLPEWYYDFQKINYDEINKWNINSEILIIGAGTSSLLEYLSSKKFPYITVLDYSEPVIKFLKRKYEIEFQEWDCIYFLISSLP
jgi:hypothetical protein